MLTFLQKLNALLWNFPLLFLLLFTHIYFTLHLHGVQKNIFHAIKLSVLPEDEDKQPSKKHASARQKGLSGFAALSTTLAATLGTGNIIGVSTSIMLGGPGAVFWCWLTGILGMATTYAECFLSASYRQHNEKYGFHGGPMYVMRYGVKKKGLAAFYAFCTLCASLGVGCSTQANAITETCYELWHISPYVSGIIAAAVIGVVLVGGIRSIGTICQKLVPAMGIFYLLSCMILLIMNAPFVLPALESIFKHAFMPSSIAGGIIGSTAQSAARYGISRGLFTNEAGIGSAGIASAASQVKNPKNQALISMTATFWDTVVLCFITGLVIMSYLEKYKDTIPLANIPQTGLTSLAFSEIPYGEVILGVSLIAFAISTLIGWSYFGEQAVYYLTKEKGIKCYQFIYVFMIFFGGILSLDLVWELSDCINAFMAVPNLIALFYLWREVK